MRRSVSALLAAALLLSPALAHAGWEDGLAAYQRSDWTTAARELRPLAEAGDPRAQARYGRLLLEGLGIPKNEAEGVRLLRAAADRDDADAEVWLANALSRGRGGLSPDPAAAAALLQRAADQGLPIAENNLAALYLAGLGVPRDISKGLDLLRAAAAKGQAAAADNLARIYWLGEPVPKDHPQALVWLRQAAEGGSAWSQNVLGLALFNGDSVAQDQTQAVAWFRRAAEKGLAAAQFNLGQAYHSGQGIARDQVEAYAWLSLAATNAAPKEKPKFEQERDRTAALLLPSEQERARQLAAAYSAGRPPPPAILPPPAARATAGSGFFVAADGLVLTNNHVVPACRTIRVTPSTAAVAVEATVVGRDMANDLALLRTGLSPAAVVHFRQDKPMRSGDGVVVVGYPLSSLLSREPNVTAGVVSAMAGEHGDSRYFQITAPVQKGNSGGPLADMSGNVVGVVSLKLNAMAVQKVFDDMPENVNFALKADYARRFLSANGVAARTAPANESLSAADVGDRIKKAAVFIECQP